MSIERRPWLVLLCLPLLAGAVAPLRADGPEGWADDFFTIWRTFSDAAQQNAAPETVNMDTPSFQWLFGSSPGVAPRVPVVRLADSILDPSPIASRNDADAAPPSLWEQPDSRPRKISQKSDGLLGSLSTQVEVTDAPVACIWDDPSWKRTWQTNDSWQLGVAGPIAVFGQFGANSDEAGQSNMKVSGRTGVTCKLPVGSLAEFTFRSGPGVSYTDPLHPLRTQGRSDWLLEVQARWPLLFGIGLEYQGSANPALTPLQQDTINQDLRLALPLGSSGKLKVGAKHQWMGLLDQRAAWSDNTQLYLGLELSR
jgi:hypothetical protein